MRDRIPPARTAAALSLASSAATSCTGGVNAGEEGGLAFIVFTLMLVATVAILWFVLGRED